ncbi:MAG: DUF6455 family protein [Alphaproteobacteria bacterium]
MVFPAILNFDPPVPPNHFIARCAERFRGWRRKRRFIGEMRKAAALGRLDAVLADLGLSRAELDELITAPADAGREFEIMARMEGLDPDRLRPEVLRDAMRKCTRCEGRDACKHWLRTGVWRHDGDPRCPNAGLFRR